MPDTETTDKYLINPGPVDRYGEWGCHMCPRENRDCGVITANREAREHLQATGHDVYVVEGTSRALRAMRIQPERMPGEEALPYD